LTAPAGRVASVAAFVVAVVSAAAAAALMVRMGSGDAIGGIVFGLAPPSWAVAGSVLGNVTRMLSKNARFHRCVKRESSPVLVALVFIFSSVFSCQ
jgi:hypothetical protein